jgi:hypothetical protein
VSYFAERTDVVKIFDDLDQFRDFCRFEGHVFNEGDLYNKRSRIYREFEAYKANGFKSVRRPYKKKNWKKK